MYVPASFAAEEEWAGSVIDRYPLAQIVLATTEGLVAGPVPMLRRGDALVGHVARPNPLWHHPGPALAIFSGADTYISPSWYPAKAEHGKVVPTWNYETVHVHGTLVVHDDDPWKRAVVELLTETFEAPLPSPWSVGDAPDDFVEVMLRGIVGIELVDVRIETKQKMSQNRAAPDREGAMVALDAGDARQRAVARSMRDSTT